MGRIVEGVLNELLLASYFESTILLLKFGDNIFHVLFNLILFFDLKAISGVDSQLWVELIFLLTY